ncbi:MAG: Mrp/NBP35 family ATP-binding protein [Elusimicrobia bacterium]|jgi:ATP-binding protein involved in chromosome partitioning|nr:Mrp/NBP35 family ATP-binding protein [Elusimicrobiota bacterium]
MSDNKAKIKENFKDIDKKIIVLSNKGGVGKSAISINLAYYLAEAGYKIGLFDADLHGPSAVKAMGLEKETVKSDGEKIMPLQKGNLKVISMASFIESEDSPLIWRGPMKMKAIQQFAGDVKWGKLDFMIVDCPPGTGDEPLSVVQLFDGIDGGVVVTTPQDIALLDSRKAVNFLKELNVPILGVIENMSGFKCPHCNKNIDIFKEGGGKKAAARLYVEYLGKIPLDINVVESMDKGLDLFKEFPQTPAALQLNKIGKKIRESLKVILKENGK